MACDKIQLGPFLYLASHMILQSLHWCDRHAVVTIYAVKQKHCCTALQMCSSADALLYCCTAALLYCCTVVLLCCCAALLLCACTAVLLYCCAVAVLYRYAAVMLC